MTFSKIRKQGYEQVSYFYDNTGVIELEMFMIHRRV